MKFIIIITIFLQIFYIVTVNCEYDNKIVIVGAGVAGLSSASRLYELGFRNINILEAENRIGGRILTKQINNSFFEFGMYNEVNHNIKSPVYMIAKNYSLLEEILYDEFYDVYKTDGQKINHASFNKILMVLDNILSSKDIVKYRNTTIVANYVTQKLAHLRKTNKYKRYIKNNMKQTTLRFYETKIYGIFMFDDWRNENREILLKYNDMPDKAHTLKGKGFVDLLDILLKKYPDGPGIPVDIQLNTKVTKIFWDRDDDKVIVETENGKSITADKVIVTLPLGVLKLKHMLIFEPKLPQTKIKAIENLNVATINRLFIQFEEDLWNNDNYEIFIMWTDRDYASLTGNREWLKGINKISNTGKRDFITIEINGKFAQLFEEVSDESVKVQILWVLNKINIFENIPNITSIMRTNWLSSPNFCGAYSFRGLSAYSANVTNSMLGEPLRNRNGVNILFFAGEATHNEEYGTVDGAIISGFTAVQDIFQSV